MLYLVRNLEQAYDKLKDILKNDKLRIYMFSTNSGKIKVDIEKTIEDLKYISTFYSFYLLEFNSELIKELKSLKELSLKDWQDIFYNFNAENEYSIYSKRLEKKDYEKVISQMTREESSGLHNIIVSSVLSWAVTLWRLLQCYHQTNG